MCIVSYVHRKNGFILTSNRDENPNRKTINPDYYFIDNQTFIFPKDKKAGGTWFAINCTKSQVGCILNAQQPHHKKSNQSRGVFLLNHLKKFRFYQNLTARHFQNLPPFEYLFIDYKQKYPQFRTYYWDGQKLLNKKSEPLKNELWSSKSLYSREKHSENLSSYNRWIKQNPNFNQESVMQLHEDYFVQGLKSKNFHRHQQTLNIQTVSITSLSVDGDNKKLVYRDLISKEITEREFY